jgi:phosphoglycolate phosphatase
LVLENPTYHFDTLQALHEAFLQGAG